MALLSPFVKSGITAGSSCCGGIKTKARRENCETAGSQQRRHGYRSSWSYLLKPFFPSWWDLSVWLSCLLPIGDNLSGAGAGPCWRREWRRFSLRWGRGGYHCWSHCSRPKEDWETEKEREGWKNQGAFIVFTGTFSWFYCCELKDASGEISMTELVHNWISSVLFCLF